MEQFCQLFRRLDETTRTSQKLEAMRDYFLEAPAPDAAWAVYVLSGRRLKRLVKHGDLRRWSAELAELPDWLFEECYHTVGDLAETIALVLGSGEQESVSGTLTEWFEERILPLGSMKEEGQRLLLQQAWSELGSWSRFVYNKLITGGLRIGVSQRSVIKALSLAYDLEPNVISHRMMGTWEPTPEFFNQLISPDAGETALSQPYPFCLAHALNDPPETLGSLDDWHAEWKWDGIRAQILRRGDEFFLWSRGEELLNERFPELDDDILDLPEGTVIDGEVLGWKDGRVLPFGDLQKRINRKKVGPKVMKDVPIRFIAFDLLEFKGEDIRQQPFAERRRQLEKILATDDESRLMLSPEVIGNDWDELAEERSRSRDLAVEGLMLKKKSAPYEVGRVTGTWWKWKIEPYTIDAVLIYAQAGHGRRASLYTDYTFALWQGDTLVPFAKAYSGLTDAEIRRVDRFIRNNTLERFGPVRSVKAELVFELGFENIQRSTRHKSGVAVRFPRIHRWREDKKPEDADRLEHLLAMMPSEVETITTAEEQG